MSTKYKATIPDTGYFVTITIVGCCGHGLQIRAIGLSGALCLKLYLPFLDLKEKKPMIAYINKQQTSIW
jgi:hypothetical protein